jgi:hypothetical protein
MSGIYSSCGGWTVIGLGGSTLAAIVDGGELTHAAGCGVGRLGQWTLKEDLIAIKKFTN